MTGGKWLGIGAACLWVSLGLGGPAAAEPAAQTVRGNPIPAVTFALDRIGDTKAARRAELTVDLNGEPAGKQELAVIVESPMLSRFMIPMNPGDRSHSWRATAVLELEETDEPPADRETVWKDPQKNFHRVDVSVARLKGMRATPFLQHSVYVTIQAGPKPKREAPAPPPAPAPAAPPPVVLPAPAAAAAPWPGIEREPVAPVVDGAVTETDLPLPKPVPATIDYWQEVQQRVTTRFGQRVKKRASAQLPRVQFRLYPDGVARIIFIERTSGNRQTDQAGLDSVVDAHPFPPFPSSVTEPYVDVHVDFRKQPR